MCRGGGAVVVGNRLHAVIIGGHEPGVLDLLIHVGLEQLIEARGFGGDVIGGHKLGLDGDTELVGRVTGEAEALAVV